MSSAALCTAATGETAIFNTPKVAPSGNKWAGNMLMFHFDINMKRLKIRFKNDSFQWFRVDSLLRDNNFIHSAHSDLKHSLRAVLHTAWKVIFKNP